jgi:hypothetical protein
MLEDGRGANLLADELKAIRDSKLKDTFVSIEKNLTPSTYLVFRKPGSIKRPGFKFYGRLSTCCSVELQNKNREINVGTSSIFMDSEIDLWKQHLIATQATLANCESEESDSDGSLKGTDLVFFFSTRDF